MNAEGGIASVAARPAERWADARVWHGDGLRREVRFFRSGGVDLYGSLYAAAEPSCPYGIVACGSWGVEADRTDPLLRSTALAMARLGGAGFVFHYPGYGDSYGSLPEVTMADLSEAAGRAVEEAARRCPGRDWILAGFMFGASVACLAQRQVDVKRLLLVQPSLRPGAYFARLTESRRPLAPGPSPRDMVEADTAEGMVYGYPIPRLVVERASDSDEEVETALEAFDGEGAVIRHERPTEPDPVPARFERVTVAGPWRFGSLNQPGLAAATSDWLTRVAGAR